MSKVTVGRGGLIRVTIYEAAVDAMHQPGGMVWTWQRKAASETSRRAKTIAPKRSGDLARSIRVRSETRVSRRVVGYYVAASVRTVPAPHWKRATPYAYMVHEGVKGMIRSNRRYPWKRYFNRATGRWEVDRTKATRGYLLVPILRYPGRQTDVPRSMRERRQAVRGQKANPFLSKSMRYVMRKVAR